MACSTVEPVLETMDRQGVGAKIRTFPRVPVVFAGPMVTLSEWRNASASEILAWGPFKGR